MKICKDCKFWSISEEEDLCLFYPDAIERPGSSTQCGQVRFLEIAQESAARIEEEAQKPEQPIPYTVWFVAETDQEGKPRGVEKILNSEFFCVEEEARDSYGTAPHYIQQSSKVFKGSIVIHED